MPKVTVIQPTLTDEQITKQRCAAYCRVSSDSMDQLNSFYAQTRYYSQIFENSETEQLVDVYADEGITGTREDKRDEFQRMMKDCRKGKIDRIYTKSISRFSRNTRDCLKSIRELKELWVTIYFEKENIDTADITDEVMITIMGGLAQEESTSISNNMRWSIQHRMKSGTMKPPNSPFGYKLENGTLNVDNQEAKVVKQIFGWYLMGYGSNIIAKRLNDMKIVNNRKVCHWTSVAVRLVLRNEKYVGDQLYQKNYTTDTLPFKRMINRGEYPQYYYTDMHQPIISREEFEMVQKILHDRERFNSGISHKHILAKKIYCSKCNSTYALKKRNGKFYWVCRMHDVESDKCDAGPIAEDKITNAFIRLCNKLLHNYEQILIPLQTSFQDLKMKNLSSKTQVMDIHKEIANLKEQTHVLARLKTKGFMDEEKYRKQTAEITVKISKLQRELNKLTKSDDEDETLEQLDMLIDFFERREAPFKEFEESAFESIVEKIVVSNNIELSFHMLGGLVLKETI